MGLDSVELIMALEEAFGVELYDEEVFEAVTPKKIGDKIYNKLQSTDKNTCQTQRAFYILRRSFMHLFNLPRESIKPDMPFRHLIPKEKEMEVWQQIRSSIQARSWPKFSRSPILVWSLFGLILFSGVFLAVSLLPSREVSSAVWAGILLAISLGVVAEFVTRPLRIRIPSEFKVIRNLVPYAVTSDQVKWTREQVSELVRKVVIDELALNESEYTEDSHFVYDFGVD